MTTIRASLHFFVFSVFAACAPASTTPAAITPVTPPSSLPVHAGGCDASGDVLFEIDRELGTDPVTPESADILYASGGWRSTNTEGKNTTGCLTASELETAKRDVESSTWAVEEMKGAHCGAITLERTIYLARGKNVWSAAGCSSSKLDDTSERNLVDLRRLIDTATSRPAASPR